MPPLPRTLRSLAQNQIWGLLLILGVSAILLAGIGLLVMRFQANQAPPSDFREDPLDAAQAEEDEAEAAAAAPALPTFAPLLEPTASQVRRRAVEARGDQFLLRALHMEGAMLYPDRSYQVELTYRYPQRMRLKLILPDDSGSWLLGYDGEEAWKQTRTFGAVPDPEILQGDLGATIASEARLPGIVRELSESALNAQLLEKTQVGPWSCYGLLFEHPTLEALELYFDDEHFFLRQVVRPEAFHSGTRKRIVTLYEDYRYVDGLWLAFSERSLVGGAPLSEMRFESIELVQGVLSSYFAAPPAL